ncbi:MAG: DUF447 domain-containing protein [Thiotrichales bacterium]
MPFIRECIITTYRHDGSAHVAPMGVHVLEDSLMVAPFKPSTTLDNLQRDGVAVINQTDDVRVYAGCVTGRRDWPTHPAEILNAPRLADCLAHTEIAVDHIEDDVLRPRFYCRIVHQANHHPFQGYNRAQAAVIEAAILATRLGMLEREKIVREIQYLSIAIERTAGPLELEAWEWLMQVMTAYRGAV